MKPREILKKLQECKFLVVKGGITLIVKPSQFDKVLEAFRNNDMQMIEFQGEVFPKYSIIGLFTFEKYFQSQMVSKELEGKLTKIRGAIASEQTREMLSQYGKGGEND